jgi:hypothetical protein
MQGNTHTHTLSLSISLSLSLSLSLSHAYLQTHKHKHILTHHAAKKAQHERCAVVLFGERVKDDIVGPRLQPHTVLAQLSQQRNGLLLQPQLHKQRLVRENPLPSVHRSRIFAGGNP